MKPKEAMHMWTNGAWMRWEGVQSHQRGFEYDDHGRRIKIDRRTNSSPEVMSMAKGMNRYFKHAPLRAPAVPPGESIEGMLFRGIRMSDTQFKQFLARKVWTDKGHMAFSTDPEVAYAAIKNTGTLTHRVIFAMKRSHVPRYTPWVWYGRPLGSFMPKNKIRTRHGPSSEVLLPPGMVYADKFHRDDARGVTFVGVRYVPLKSKERGIRNFSRIKAT